MITGLSLALRNALLQEYANAIDAGDDPSEVWLYEGPAPDPGESAGDLKLLIQIPLPRPFAASIEDGVLTANDFEPIMALSGGFAVWCRVYDGDGTWVHDGDVSDEHGEGFIRLSGGINILSGGLVMITGCTISI